MTDQRNIVRVFTGSIVEVKLLKNQLKDVGVESMMRDEFTEGAHAGFATSIPGAVDLYIFEEDLEKAKALVEEMKHK